VPLELEPELLWPDVLPEPLVDGVGDVVLGALELPEALPDVLDELWPEVLPEAPLCAPKWASHSVRETCPSPFLSTIVKLGVDEDAPAELLDEEGLVEVDGVCELVLAPAPAEPLIEPELFCALVLPCAPVAPLEDDLLASFADTAPDSARSAAAVELTRIFSII
jgi:hypothetical protein